MSGPPIDAGQLAGRLTELYRPSPLGHWRRRTVTLLQDWLGRSDLQVPWTERCAHENTSAVRVPLLGRAHPPKFLGFDSELSPSEQALCRLISPHLGTLAEQMERVNRPSIAVPPRWGRVLTRRQAEVAGYAAHGLRNDEIASQLSIAPRTVVRLLQEAYSRLDYSKRSELAAEAALGRPPTPIHGDPKR